MPELIVDQAYTFNNLGSRSNILLSSGAKITINSAGYLTLLNCDMFTCSTLARGIEIQTGGALTTTGSTLNDSRFAINAKPGSSISISTTGFFDNYIGLNLDMTSAAEAAKRVNILAFNGNAFSTVQTAINAPYAGMPEAVEARGYCGIKLTDYRDFNVYGGNSFSQLANGILVVKSTLNIANMSFDDMNSTGGAIYPLEGFGVHLGGKGNRPYWAHINELWGSMTFNNCKTGVFANHYSAFVSNTTMTNVDVGIDWTFSPTAEIKLRSNTISARHYGIRSFVNEPFHVGSVIDDNTIVVTTSGGGITPVTGIEMQETGMGFTFPVSGWSVARNSVTMNQGGRGILYRNGVGGTLDANTVFNLAQPNNYTGIFTESDMFTNIARNSISQSGGAGLGTSQGIYSSGGTANTFQCNCLDNTNVGAQFYDLADFTNAVRGNNFNTHTTGLQLGNQGIGDVFVGRQNHTGNLWDLAQIPSGEFGGINWGGSAQIIELSKFNVTGTTGATSEHPSVDPSSDWFVPTPGGSFTCSNACVFPATPGSPTRVPESDIPTDLDVAIVNDTLSGDADMAWKGKYRLFRKILRHPAIESYSSEYAAFKAAQASQPVGRLAYIAEERAKLFALSATDQITDSSYRDSVTQQTTALRNLDSLLQAGSPVNVTQYNTLVQQKAVTEANYAIFLKDNATLREGQIEDLLSLNTSLSTSQTCVTNHKTVNGIILNYLLTEVLSAGDSATLADIAVQCPIEGGDAVYEARVMVERFTGQTFNDAVLCSSESRPSQERKEKLENAASVIVALYPNPTTGLLQWTDTVGQTQMIKVFDQLGILVKEQRVENLQTDLSILPNGFYFVQIMDADGALLIAQKVFLKKS